MLLKLTEIQVKFMTNNPENVYIRCAGFLYIRYLCEPKELYNRLSPYLYEVDLVQPTVDSKNLITIGEYVENLLKDYDYYRTRLPRIPTPIEREIKAKLLEVVENRKRKAKNLDNLYLFTKGKSCNAVSFQDGNWHKGKIISQSQLGGRREITKICVRFTEGLKDIINLYDTYKSEDRWNNFEIFKMLYEEHGDKRDKAFYSSEEIVDLYNIELTNSEDEKKEIENDKFEIKSVEEGEIIVSNVGTKQKNKKGHRSNSKGLMSSSNSSRSSSRDKKHRHKHKKDKKNKKRRSRSRSRSRSFIKEIKIEKRSNHNKLTKEELMKKIKENEKEAAVAKGKEYAAVPSSYKSSLSVKLPGSNIRKHRSKSPSPLKQNIQIIENKKEKDNQMHQESKKKKTEYSKEFLERQEQLKKQYLDDQKDSKLSKSINEGKYENDLDYMQLG